MIKIRDKVHFKDLSEWMTVVNISDYKVELKCPKTFGVKAPDRIITVRTPKGETLTCWGKQLRKGKPK